MRNLKKFLALVMAMVMAFSLMLTVNAANPVKTFDDAGNITEEFVEAADVLTGMKVFQGDEGGFRPGDNITRAEVAALIYRLATGDTGTEKMDLYTTTHPFTDVAAGDWFAGYVGYCWNAGYIKGTTATTFNPYDSVTGYETLAMVLRAMGYDKNGEFTGSSWIVNVSSTATQRGLLDDVKTTHYGNTLHLASRRDVVASILFQAAQKTRVVYTPAFGYQSGDHTTSTVTDLYDNYSSLGWLNFGLVSTDKGVVIGNQQTGEKNTRLGFPGYVDIKTKNSNGFVEVTSQDTVPAWDDTNKKNVIVPFIITPYAYEGRYDATDMKTVEDTPATLAAGDEFILSGNNDKFNLETGVDLMGHKVKIWFDGRDSKFDSTKGHPTYAYFDKADTAVIYAEADDNGDLNLKAAPDNNVNITQAIKDAGFKVNDNQNAVWNNSFGKFGTLSLKANNHATDADEVSLGTGDGVALDGDTNTDLYQSPVKLYKIIDNNGDKKVDAIIALNIESSQVTESNAVNRVPTIGVPVDNKAADPEAPATGSFFVEGQRTVTGPGQASKNLKQVGDVETGVLAKDALVGNSVSALGDYEMGVHITGTTRRDVSANEATAINFAAAKDDLESSYFLLSRVTATIEGKVVAYNRAAGTVTLDNGTVLNRSKFYDTVVIKNRNVSSTIAPNSAIPQGWIYDANATTDPITEKWVEGYANETYKFYTDYEGKYLGAERSYGSTFLYGTYLDYDQKTSSSTFNYYLTGVNMNGEIETVPVSKYWTLTEAKSNLTLPYKGDFDRAKGTSAVNINGTNVLGIPFRDTANSAATSVNGLGEGLYTGFAINSGVADFIVADTNMDRSEYLANMARLGIKYAAFDATGLTDNKNEAFDIREIEINNDDVTLGARETINSSDRANARTTQTNNSGKYFTEATKFILVSGFGTDSVKAEVYNGISELKGNAARVFIKMNGAVDGASNDTTIKLNSAWTPRAANLMTYYTESPYTYAQSGQTAMKIDTIILPKEAVSWSGGSGLYYVGNPGYSSINSWGTDAWKYDLYEDGELKQVWLTNDPSQTAGTAALTDPYSDKQLTKDTFYNLKDTGEKANDGQPIYTAGNYNGAGVWTAGTGVAYNFNPTAVNSYANQRTMSSGNKADSVIYSAVTRDAQTATFTQYKTIGFGNVSKLYRVAEAKVVNLNVGAKKDATATVATPDKNASGEIWPGITDLATLNEAGSIDPVTGRRLKVAAVVDPTNPLVITTIYVCWDQTPV